MEYKSKDYDKIMSGEIDNWADIQDYLAYPDVNSLYPFAQLKNEFAYGKWIVHHCDLAEEDDLIYLSEAQSRRLKPEFQRKRANLYRFLPMINKANDVRMIKRCMFEVDVTCPKDLITAYLYERDPVTKEVRYNLHDKKKQWYWGCEIIEARLLGYCFTHVYTVYEFPKSGDLFKGYVEMCWKNRQENPKDGEGSAPAINLANKQAMNRLTGKFGQLSPKTYTYLMRGNDPLYIEDAGIKKYSLTGKKSKFIQFSDSLVDRIEDFTILFSDDGSSSIIVMDIAYEEKNPRYPISLSGQILAYSRVYMSNIIRACNGYLDKEKAFYYTDTDSLCIHRSALPLLRAYIGSDIGKLSCDIDDSFMKHGNFAKVVRGIWGAPKGPYAIVSMKYHEGNKKGKLMEKIRLKGIPHTNMSFPHENKVFEVTNIDTLKEMEWHMNRIEMFLAGGDGFTFEPVTDMIKKKYYCIKEVLDKEEQVKEGNVNEIRYFTQFINFHLIQKIVYYSEKISVFVFFGGMKKEWNERNNTSLSKFSMIKPHVIQRQIGKVNWWEKGLRIFFEKEEEEEGKYDEDDHTNRFKYALSYPQGYERTSEDEMMIENGIQTRKFRAQLDYSQFIGTQVEIFC